MILEHLPILEEYIQTYHVDAFEKIGENIKIHLHIQFKDHSRLYIKEILIQGQRKYAYHWQDNEDNMICRWDNAPDWPEIGTFPHHKHLKDKTVPSSENETQDIFHQIKSMLENK